MINGFTCCHGVPWVFWREMAGFHQKHLMNIWVWRFHNKMEVCCCRHCMSLEPQDTILWSYRCVAKLSTWSPRIQEQNKIKAFVFTYIINEFTHCSLEALGETPNTEARGHGNGGLQKSWWIDNSLKFHWVFKGHVVVYPWPILQSPMMSNAEFFVF